MGLAKLGNLNLLQQVTEERLLGAVINDRLTWDYNTNFIVKKAYKRMIMLHKLFEFGLPQEEMINIYLLHIRSILESSAVGGHSSPALADEMTIERVQ